MRHRASAAVVAAALTGAVLTGCGGEHPGESALTVYAAASLALPFGELLEEFERVHPEVSVAPLVLDGSATLATQIAEGAPADVFASADRRTLERLAAHGHGRSHAFAHNMLQLAVAPGNPLGITGIPDLADPAVHLVTCAPEVPCGAAAAELLESSGVEVTPVSEEQSVTAVLAKVAGGQADAGLVYVTDVAASGGSVTGIELPGAERVLNEYRIAALDGAADPRAARAFVDHVLSARGRAILTRHGFAP